MAGQEFSPSPEEEAVLTEVLHALRQISHGYIQLVVQDSRIVQIEKTEKMRLARPMCRDPRRTPSP